MKTIFLFLLTTLSISAIAQSNSAIIQGNLDFAKDRDSVILTIYNHTPFNGEAITVKKVTQGRFLFKVLVNKSPLCIGLEFPRRGANSNESKDIRGFFIEKGDNIVCSTTNGKVHFSGRGAKKWAIQNELARLEQSPRSKPDNNDGVSGIINRFEFADSLFFLKIKLLLANRKELGDLEFKLLLADNIATSRFLKSFAVKFSHASKTDISAFYSSYKEAPFNTYFTKSDSATILPFSTSYCAALIEKYKLDSCYQRKVKFSVTKAYDYFCAKYSGALRDNLLTLLLYDSRKSSEDTSNCFKDALETIQDTGLVRVVNNIRFALTDTFQFVLPDTSGKSVALTDFKGKMVLLDFWFTGCTPCRLMAQQLKKVEAKVNPDSVVFISINVDKSKDRWIASVKGGLYTTPRAISLNTQPLGKDHPLIKHYLITGYPTLLIIDKQQRLKRPPQNPSDDNGKDLIDLLR